MEKPSFTWGFKISTNAARPPVCKCWEPEYCVVDWRCHPKAECMFSRHEALGSIPSTRKHTKAVRYSTCEDGSTASGDWDNQHWSVLIAAPQASGRHSSTHFWCGTGFGCDLSSTLVTHLFCVNYVRKVMRVSHSLNNTSNVPMQDFALLGFYPGALNVFGQWPLIH